MTLEAIQFDSVEIKLTILDQRLLPHSTLWVPINNAHEGYIAIKDMLVRGAPAIALVGVLSVVVELANMDLESGQTKSDIAEIAARKLDSVVAARPTAVNLSNMASYMKQYVADLVGEKEIPNAKGLVAKFAHHAATMLRRDVEGNKEIGEHGANWVVDSLRSGKLLNVGPEELQAGKTKLLHSISVLTICNTGSLATAGYGTALGVIRSMFTHGVLKHAYCLETRPYNQGARLTAYELVHDKIPSTLICDSMAGALLKQKDQNGVRMVVVGADRIASNGDTANKIGTYQLAVLAKYHGVKFVVAAPTSTIDLNTQSGDHITIEQRPSVELTRVKGAPVNEHGEIIREETATVAVAAEGIDVWNPSFDVTPNELIDAIVTEQGLIERGPNGYDFSKLKI